MTQISVRAYLGGRNFSNDGVLTESGAAHEMEDFLSVFRESRGSIRHHTFSLKGSDGWAQVCLVAHAENAVEFAALRSIAGDDSVTDFDCVNSVTNTLNDSSSLMT